MISMLIKFWPALIPILCYAVWIVWRRRKAIRLGAPPPSWFDGNGLWVACASLITMVACFVWLALQSAPNTDPQYQPTRFKDGKLIDGTLN